VLKVDRAFLSDRPRGWLTAWSTGLEEQGCFAPGEGMKFAERVAESLPLDSDSAFRLLFRNDIQTGTVDLGPQIRLQVVSPLGHVNPEDPIVDIAGSGTVLDVTVKSPARLTGYEVAWYTLHPKAQGAGLTIVPGYAERHIGDDIERRQVPATNYFRFPPAAAFYRLFYKADQTKFTALVIAAPTRPELDRRTQILQTNTASCARLDNELCVEIPRSVAVNPMKTVTINSVEAPVALGADVGGAIRASGNLHPESVLKSLTVSRLYNGRPTPVDFDRSNPAILRLILNGGEAISWSLQ
jgi:hypothetical protein